MFQFHFHTRFHLPHRPDRVAKNIFAVAGSSPIKNIRKVPAHDLHVISLAYPDKVGRDLRHPPPRIVDNRSALYIHVLAADLLIKDGKPPKNR